MTVIPVTCPANLETVSFERLLKRFYRTTLQSKAAEVTFDLQKVEWCEPFQLSLLTLWIDELRSRGITVNFQPPSPQPLKGENGEDVKARIERRVDSYSYLVQCGFIAFLRQRTVLTETDLDTFQSRRSRKPTESSISPLVPFSGVRDFNDFMTRIHEQYKLQFSPLEGMGVVESGDIRDIVLRELGENIFDHAGGRFGHLLMTLKSEVSDLPDTVDARIRSALSYEIRFFQHLRGSGYLVLVISDKGPGIPRKLREAYGRDELLTNKQPRPPQHVLIDYAFFQHSTSKTKEQRLGHLILDLRAERIEDFVPATGLWYVREVVKAYSGLLLVRSGRAMVCYDFLSYPDTGRPASGLLTNKPNRQLGALEDFGGTQIRIYFPTTVTARKNQSLSISVPALIQGTSPGGDYRYVSLRAYRTAPSTESDRQIAAWIDEKLGEVHKFKLSSQSQKTFVVDCEGWEEGGSWALKALWVFLIRLMRIQDSSFRIGIVNAHGLTERFSPQLIPMCERPSGIVKERALFALNEHFELAVIGLLPADEAMLRSLLAGEHASAVTSVISKLFLERTCHLITLDTRTGMVGLSFSLGRIRRVVVDGIGRELEKVIMDPGNRVFHPGPRCFLIPSGAYSDAFFELRNFLDSETNFVRMNEWIRHILVPLRVSHLVSLGSPAGRLAGLVARKMRNVQHLNIAGPRNPLQSLQLALLPKDAAIAILTDVIGTQRSLDTVLMSASNTEVKIILTVVDAREKGEASEVTFRGNTYPLKSVVRSPIRFWLEDIPRNYKYEDVVRVDPVSNAPIFEPPSSGGAIWKKVDISGTKNEFVSELLARVNGILIGHFESSARHIIYLFLTPAIAAGYGPTIADAVHKNLDWWSTRIRDFPDSIAVYYPEHTPGVGEIAKEISNTLRMCPVEVIPWREISSPHSYPRADLPASKSKAAIIFDDASSTGSSARRMIDVIERRGFTHIFLYILCNRAEPTDSRLLYEIKQYGRAQVQVQYLCELPIPTFSSFDCPICRKVEALGRSKRELPPSSKVAPLIDQEIYALQHQPVARVSSPDFVTSYVSTPLGDRVGQTELRAQLQLAKVQIALRKSLSDIAASCDVDPQRALQLLTVIGREQEFFLNDATGFAEVFYPGFRSSLIAACRYFLQRVLAIPEPNAAATVSLLAALDPEAMLDSLRGLPTNGTLTARLVGRIGVELLSSTCMKDKAAVLAELFESWSKDLESEAAGIADHFTDLWRTMAESRHRSTKAFNAFKECYYGGVSDSGYLSSAFGNLEYKRFSSLGLHEIEERVTRCWPEILANLTGSLIPNLEVLTNPPRDLANLGVRLDISDKLTRRLEETIALVSKSEELKHTLFDNQVAEGDRKAAASGFQGGVAKLHSLLFEGEESVCGVLKALRTNLNRVLVRVVEKHKEEFHDANIALELKIPDYDFLVFGHEQGLYAMIDPLLDNVHKRAFEQGATGEKHCMVEITLGNEGIVDLVIFDNGRGVGPDLQYGVGLSTVAAIAHYFCDDWEICPAADPFRTQARLRFYDLKEWRGDR
jgi:hypothetical protein